MIQLVIIPGPKHPKNIASFLESIVEDLHMLQTSGLRIQTISGQGIPQFHTMCFVGEKISAPMRTMGSLCQFERNRYCVNGPNVFRDLNTLTSPAFFRFDEIHLIGHGIGHQLYNVLNSKFVMSNKTEDNDVQQADHD
ncbi:hypothetical protein PHYBLDRAFT_67491 [Phycomyces blakesleeanus NRRL 1555(-)]|uniref:Uncharacterized protein n=1 Tax=Phycomyces blakesleeanus (strain ATCC 8743b / DSM 1359 / FGSC 10004 / NBRC 33097 / NRRL 1555) TaxID=763407 RepID=A0A162U9K7_PHYB8|nr:hypothetical protein PHYBLDRAFT_67491 [Phycomyces blakesleeanus NRRL 1555(-)]OAD74592.1 hypothetical protein PHYBLDRAFT_67491 [Phycomyces blakesleeanus NRRL 1555(-)]|eukprot:XP_018292632.1 hypothetical protein PHYBLDRAFT_67491 [Phycomyces blakesleeanus NRRL 1555(-)]